MGSATLNEACLIDLEDVVGHPGRVIRMILAESREDRIFLPKNHIRTVCEETGYTHANFRRLIRVARNVGLIEDAPKKGKYRIVDEFEQVSRDYSSLQHSRRDDDDVTGPLRELVERFMSQAGFNVPTDSNCGREWWLWTNTRGTGESQDEPIGIFICLDKDISVSEGSVGRTWVVTPTTKLHRLMDLLCWDSPPPIERWAIFG